MEGQPMSTEPEYLYPEGQDETTATIRAAIIRDDDLGLTYQDTVGDGMVASFVPFSSRYVVTAHADAETLAERVRDLVRDHGWKFAARFVRIFVGTPVTIVWAWEHNPGLVYLDPTQLEATGAPATEDTLAAEVESFRQYNDGDVYGVSVEVKAPTTYMVEIRQTWNGYVGTTTQTTQTVSTDRDAITAWAEELAGEVETIPGEWEPTDEGTVWGILGDDAARETARELMAEQEARA
jgi:hypothetical protein